MKARILSNGSFGGIFSEDFFIKNIDKIINGELVSNWVTTDILPDVNIAKPIWENNSWVEGLTEEEISVRTLLTKESYRKSIYAAIEELSVNSKSRALGKSGQNLTIKQLSDLEIFYTEKRKIAEEHLNSQTISNDLILELIVFEVESDFAGTLLDDAVNYLNVTYSAGIDTNLDRLSQYCSLILVKYELGRQLDAQLKSFIEYFRSKLITHLDNADFVKLNDGILLVQSITTDMSIAEITTVKNNFNAL